MSIEIKGKLIALTETKKTTGKDGKEYLSMQIILKGDGQYDKPVAIEVNGVALLEKVAGFKTGQELTVQVNLESREWEGKWFTNVKAWKL